MLPVNAPWVKYESHLGRTDHCSYLKYTTLKGNIFFGLINSQIADLEEGFHIACTESQAEQGSHRLSGWNFLSF